MPFIYSAFYIISLAVGLFAPSGVVKIFDMLFYASPITVAAFLVLSKLLRMCRWHRAACIVPVIPQGISFVDYYLVQFPASAVAMTMIILISMTIFLLVSAHKTFIA